MKLFDRVILFWQSLFGPKNRLPIGMEFLEKKEHHIPVRFCTLVNTIIADADLSEEEQKKFREFSKRIEERFHFDYHSQLIKLCDDFAPFDPDRDTIDDEWVMTMTAEEKDESKKRLIKGIQDLLEKCNFSVLTSEQLDACLELQAIGGLSVHIDNSDFESFDIYYRSMRLEQQESSFLFLWKKSLQRHVLKRIFVLARECEETGGNIIIKCFKDIPIEEIKLIAPKVRLNMPFIDHIKVGGTFFAGLVTSVYKLLFAASISLILFIPLLFGLILAGIKGFFSFQNSKIKYRKIHIDNLYSKSLSNNTCAITALVHAAEEQEIKETLLAYSFLYLSRNNPLTEQQLDEQGESWFKSRFQCDIDFEVDDAVKKLRDKNLLITHEKNGENSENEENLTYSVCDIPQALRQLDKDWDNFHTEAN